MGESSQAPEGVVLIGKGLDSLRQTQSQLRQPYFLGLMAQACIAAGQADEAMKHIRDALAVIEKGGETWAEAEIHRIKGNLLQHQGDSRGAELSYQRAFSLAGQQEARSFALRAALSLCKLWTKKGKHIQAQKVLRDMRGRFAGQEDTPDLRELDSLLKGPVRQKRSPK
jgi:predicted ATPase